jgi:hypothetical protein
MAMYRWVVEYALWRIIARKASPVNRSAFIVANARRTS